MRMKNLPVWTTKSKSLSLVPKYRSSDGAIWCSGADLLAEALLSLYQQEELRRTLASAGRARAAALGRNDSSPLYDAAIGRLLDFLAAPSPIAATARSADA